MTDKQNVCWVLEVRINDGQRVALEQLMNAMVESTRAEPGALDYRFSISQDGKTMHVLERYADSAACLGHLGAFGAKRTRRTQAHAPRESCRPIVCCA